MSTERGTGTNGRRQNGAMPGTPTGGDENEASSPLERHVRRETQEFTFSALIGETPANRDDDPQLSRPEDRFPSVLPERTRSQEESPRGRMPNRQTSPSAFRPVVPGPAPTTPPSSRSSRRSGVSLPLVVGITLAIALPTSFIVANAVINKRTTTTNAGGTVASSTSVAPAASSTVPGDAGQRKPGQPDPTLTPGERLPNARTAAPIPETVRMKVLQAYGVDAVGPGGVKTVVVRLIPASLGGTENPANLFPTTPWFAELKSRLDRYLTDQVLRRKMTVEQAEKDLKTDWIEATHRYHIRNYGLNDPKAAAETQAKQNW